MNYLDLVRFVHQEAGITQSNPEPDTTVGLVGLSRKIANWVTQAYEDIKMENDQADFVQAWFSVTCNPRFYFDLPTVGLTQTFAGDTLVGQYSGCTFLVTRVITVNNGIWADGTAQGQIEFISATGQPMDSEPLLIKNTTNVACRFIKWGDYRLDDLNEMGPGYVSNLQDVSWETLKIADVAKVAPVIMDNALTFVSFGEWSQRFDVNVGCLGTPYVVTETPDDGTRIAFWPPPDRPYRLSGYYTKYTDALVNDEDTPIGFKSMYHPMIGWRALQYYGQYEQQPGIYAEAKDRYQIFKKKIDREGMLPMVMMPVRLY